MSESDSIRFQKTSPGHAHNLVDTDDPHSSLLVMHPYYKLHASYVCHLAAAAAVFFGLVASSTRYTRPLKLIPL